MAISVFPTLEKVVTTNYTSGDILTTALDFSKNTSTNNKLGTPANVMREIQIQFITDTLGKLTVTFDDGTKFFPINDDVAIIGLTTFTIFVDNDTILDFQFSSGGSIIMTIGG